MGTIYDVKYSWDSDESPNEIALKGGGLLSRHGYGLDCPCDNPDAAPSWEVIVVNRRGMGNHGNAVLFPRTEEAKKLLLEGVENCISRGDFPSWLLEQDHDGGWMLHESFFFLKISQVFSEALKRRS